MLKNCRWRGSFAVRVFALSVCTYARTTQADSLDLDIGHDNTKKVKTKHDKTSYSSTCILAELYP